MPSRLKKPSKNPSACQRLDISSKGRFHLGLESYLGRDGVRSSIWTVHGEHWSTAVPSVKPSVLGPGGGDGDPGVEGPGTPWGHSCLPTRRDTLLTHPSNCMLESRAQTLVDLLPVSTVVLLPLWSPQSPSQKGRQTFAQGVGALFIPRTQSTTGDQTTGGEVPFLSLLISLLRGYQTNMDWEKEEGHAFPYFIYGVSCSEVEVDCLTGAHKVKSDIGVHLLHIWTWTRMHFLCCEQ